jgi:hypothetical protein
VHRRKMRQMFPRRSKVLHRSMVVDRDRWRSPRSKPDYRSMMRGNSNIQTDEIIGPKGHKAQGSNPFVSCNVGHEGPYACASSKEGLRSMIIF